MEHYEHKIVAIADLIPSETNQDNTPKEWCIINGSFAVSKCGIVLSLPRTCKSKNDSIRVVPGKVLTHYDDKDGYKLVTAKGLSKNGQVRVHRLVAECFIGQIPEGMEINHIDGDKGNNNLSNLEIVTPKENSVHAVSIGLTPVGKSHHNTKPVQISKCGFGFIAFGLAQINSIGLRAQSIHRVARGERNTYKGWEADYV